MTREINPDKIKSIRDRLKNIAHENDEDFNYVVVRYGLERMMYRLSESEYRDQFVLKGATLFLHWQGEPHRPTKDADFTGTEEMDVEDFESIVEDLCNMDVEPEDGVIFLPETIEGERIREGEVYEGIRVTLKALLGKQEFGVQLDVGFGDSMVPSPEDIDYPVLLDFPSPELKAYRRETTIAEKFQNMVEMGMGNSRMKDFYDIWFLSKNFDFEGSKLRNAIEETFKRRKTDVPGDVPMSLSDEFIEAEFTEKNWTAFLDDLDRTNANFPLDEVIEKIRVFLMPVSKSVTRNENFDRTWKPAEGWS